MSYSTFEYRNLAVAAGAGPGDPVSVSVEVLNSSAIAGEEVVQLYVKAAGARSPAPLRSLQGFARVALAAGENRKVEFALSPRQLASAAGGTAAREFEISVGGKQPGFRGRLDPPGTGVSGTVRAGPR